MGKKKQARKLWKEQKEVYESQGTSDLDWVLINGFWVVGLIFLISVALFLETGTRDYFHAHNGLFVVIFLAVISFMLRTKVTRRMITSIKKAFTGTEKLSLYEKGDLTLAGAYLLSIFGFIILDTSFFENYGFKIGTIAAISLVQMIRRFVLSKKSS